jgi:signal peptidase I
VLVMRPDHPSLVFKRVIGLPGESVEIHDNQVIVNRRALPMKILPSADFSWVPESHKMGSTVHDEDGHWAAFTPGQYRDVAAIHLTTDEYYLLGDNRDISLDCRAWGPLKEKAIVGKVIVIMRTGPRRK